MNLTKEKKEEIYEKYGISKSDTGSIKVQIAILTYRISYLSEHLKKNKKDFNSERSLVKLVCKRKRLLKYIENISFYLYKEIINELGIRK
ncbi:MAG: 30S ribosomal protein S15 [Flavobacteriia bacterium]|nr:30S ribosomal protein S15 [Candidatus Bostrichicola ureolyticus]